MQTSAEVKKLFLGTLMVESQHFATCVRENSHALSCGCYYRRLLMTLTGTKMASFLWRNILVGNLVLDLILSLLIKMNYNIVCY